MDAGVFLVYIIREILPKLAATLTAMEQANHMPRHAIQRHPLRELLLNKGNHLIHHLLPRLPVSAEHIAKDVGVSGRENAIGLVIRAAPYHHSVHLAALPHQLLRQYLYFLVLVKQVI